MHVSKKILVIAAGSYISGAEKVMYDIIQGLKVRGYQIHCVVSGWNDGNFIKKLDELTVEYTLIKLRWYYVSKIKWSLDSLVHYPKAAWKFVALKKRFNPDIVYA